MSDSCCGPSEHVGDEEPTTFWRLRPVQLSGLAGALLLIGVVAPDTSRDWVSTGAYLAALLVGSSTFVPETIANLFQRRLTVGTLMTIAAAGAVMLGEFGEAASLAFLFSISEALESYAMARTQHGLRALLELVPPSVTVRRGGVDVELTPDELEVGDLMVLRPGDRAPTDGIVRGGRSTLDVSAITGESVPIEVDPGVAVFAASVNGNGVLEVEVTARTTESSLAKVVHAVEDAQRRKGQSQRIADRIASRLVPGVLIVAAAVALVGSLAADPQEWIYRALVVLVAAAPCAFAISVPVTVVASLGAAARMGALVKGGAALEALGDIRIVALDKTGTLTHNAPVVVDVVATNGSRSDEVLRAAAALEARSEHPLAEAILAATSRVEDATDVTAVPGYGLEGKVGGDLVRLGKPGFIDARELDVYVIRMQQRGSTVVLVERADRLLGAIAVRDELRREVPDVLRRLRALGVGRIAMLTGDNKRTADALAREAGIEDVYAELLPTGKAQLIEKLQAVGATAMVGDGINDAPALATADVGIAMGAIGSDAAIEAADVALMGRDLQHLPEVFAHARRANRIMVQNLLLSGAILVALVPLAAFGALPLATVVATHEIAEVLVIANGVRAGRRTRAA